jgi:hypothetical protein
MKTALGISSAVLLALSTSGMAASHPAQVTQAQFQSLQKEVHMLQTELAQQTASRKHNRHARRAHKAQSHKTPAKSSNTHHIQRLFSEDGYAGSEFWDATNGSDFPLTMLKDKAFYGPKSMAFGGYLELEPINTWWGDTMPQYTTGAKPGTMDQNGTVTSYEHGSGIGLSAATIDFMANANKWTQIFVEANISESSELLNGFLTFGNLKKSPLYFTVGKYRLRLGVFPGAPWMASIPQGIFRPGHTYNAMLGYTKNNLSAYLAYVPQASGQKQAMMASAFYNNAFGQSGVGYAVDGGYISDIAIGSSLAGTAVDTLPGSSMVDVDGSLTFKSISLSSGWMSMLSNTSITNNAKASAWYVGAGYNNLHMFSKTIGFGVNYSAAKNTQNVLMPLAGDSNKGPLLYGVKNAAVVFADSRLSRNILAGLEFGRMWTYNHKKTNEVTLYTAFYF